jgi:hypothetical protein
MSHFREDVKIEEDVAIISLLLEGILSRSILELENSSVENSLKIVEKLTAEVKQYFEMIKRGVYQP